MVRESSDSEKSVQLSKAEVFRCFLRAHVIHRILQERSIVPVNRCSHGIQTGGRKDSILINEETEDQRQHPQEETAVKRSETAPIRNPYIKDSTHSHKIRDSSNSKKAQSKDQ